MFKYFIFLCLGVSFCAYAHQERFDGRIIGGHSVEITEYPHQVSLQKNGEHICGGSIIDKRFILTAAHCVENEDPKNLTVRAGSSNYDTGGQLIAVQKYEAFGRRDIAVLRLVKNIIIDKNASPIKLNKNEINLNQTAKVTGWGDTQENGEYSKKLQVVEVNIFSQSDCIKAYQNIGKILDTEFCAGVVGGGKDSCQGDSGGPLTVNGILYGIVSWGEGCARPEYPGVYVDVAKMGSWIEFAKVELAKEENEDGSLD